MKIHLLVAALAAVRLAIAQGTKIDEVAKIPTLPRVVSRSVQSHVLILQFPQLDARVWT
jgi:hypothetical protein